MAGVDKKMPSALVFLSIEYTRGHFRLERSKHVAGDSVFSYLMLGTDDWFRDLSNSEVQDLACPRWAYRHTLAEYWALLQTRRGKRNCRLGIFTRCLWKNRMSDLMGLLRSI